MKTGNCTMHLAKHRSLVAYQDRLYGTLKAKACSEQLKKKWVKKRTGESENIV